MSEDTSGQTPIAISLCAVYCALLVFTVGVLIVLLVEDKRARKSKWTPRYTFVVLILLLTCFRIPTFVLGFLHDQILDPTWLFWALFYCAAMLYLTIFTELILFWARMHDQMRPAVVDGSTSLRLSDRQRRIVQGVVLFIAWAVYGSLFALFFVVGLDQFTVIVSYVTCAFFAIAAIFFAVYGTLIYRRVVRMPLRSARVTVRVRRVLAVAIIMTVAFACRAVVNAVLPELSQSYPSPLVRWVIYVGTFVVLEVVPLVSVELLVVMRTRHKTDAQMDGARQAYLAHQYAYTPVPKSEQLLGVN